MKNAQSMFLFCVSKIVKTGNTREHLVPDVKNVYHFPVVNSQDNLPPSLHIS